jgi:hypothetical protein
MTLWSSLRRRLPARVPIARDYFELLMADGAAIPCDCSGTGPQAALYAKWCALRDTIAQKLKDEGDCSLVCVFELEQLQVRLLPDDRLRAKAWSVRATYTSLVSRERWQQYMATNPPDLKDWNAPIERVRCDVEDLLSGLHWWYVNAERREVSVRALKVRLLVAVCVGMFLALLCAGIGLQFHDSKLVQTCRPLAMTLYVLYAGFLGATTSTIRRIQPVADQPLSVSDPLLKAFALQKGNVGIYLSIAMGAIFALVLYLAFAAGLDAALGASAPAFVVDRPATMAASVPQSLLGFLYLIPKEAADVAKALIWSFVAGFSERLVPDMLDRFGHVKGNK